MSDRRPPGGGIFRHAWGKRSTINLISFNTSLFGGGRGPSDTLSIPTPRPGTAPATKDAALRNLWVMEAEVGESGALGMCLSMHDRATLENLKGLSEDAQRLFAGLRHACHPMCGVNDYSDCR